MKNSRKILSLIMVLMLLISSLVIAPVSVSAYSNGKVIQAGDIKAVGYEDGTAVIFESSVKVADVVIPAEIEGYTITGITGGFADNSKIKNVTIPDSVIYIGTNAFMNCEKLESITIPDSVTNIGNRAFYSCISLKEINIPENVESIGDEAFFYCTSLKTIDLPDNPNLVVSGSAFNDTAWYNAQPDGVVYLERFVLNYKGNMPNKLSVDITEGTEVVCSNAFTYEGDKDNKSLVSVTFPSTLKRIESKAFYKCVNLKTVDLPDSLEVISGSAFAYCTSIKSVTVPEGVTDLRYAFSRSGLESVTILGTPTFWSRAFYECKNLREVTLTDTLEKIDAYAFAYCSSLEAIDIPASVKEISSGAFMNCEKLKTIATNDEIYRVYNDSLENTQWYNTQPEGFVYFGDVLMGYKGDAQTLNELVIPERTKAVAGGAFSKYTNLRKVEFPEGLLVIGPNAFRETSVENIVIPKSVEFIGYFAFCYCLELATVEINSKGEIQFDAFINCINLKSITVSANVDTIGDTALGMYYSIDGIAVVDGVVIYGYAGSAAEDYAKDNEIDFVVLKNEGKTGDADLDGKITVKDATQIQKHIAGIVTIDDTVLGFADVNGDGDVNIKDATMIQKYIAGIITSFPVSI